MQEHYKEEALKWGSSSSSTMEDEITRNKEVELICNFIGLFSSELSKLSNKKPIKVADIGCGNGYTLSILSNKYANNVYYGIDTSNELLDIAIRRELDNCKFMNNDICSLAFNDNQLDIIYTERCLINLDNWGVQQEALNEIHRVLKPNEYYLMVEAFTDGLANCNKARVECGLPELKEAPFNIYLDKTLLFPYITNKFTIWSPYQFSNSLPTSNFLSSHYFISRVLHALITKGEQIKNTEFVKFFSYLPPIGNYSQIQAFVLRKI